MNTLDELIAYLTSQRQQFGNLPVFLNVYGSGPRPINAQCVVETENFGPGYHLKPSERPTLPYVELGAYPAA